MIAQMGLWSAKAVPAYRINEIANSDEAFA